jgi:hypothetical protein
MEGVLVCVFVLCVVEGIRYIKQYLIWLCVLFMRAYVV